MRVDNWDEDEAAPPVRAVPAPQEAPADVPAEAVPGEPVAEAGEAPAEEEERIDWRQAIRTAPPWLMLTAAFTIGSIIIMCFTVLLLIALK